MNGRPGSESVFVTGFSRCVQLPFDNNPFGRRPSRFSLVSSLLSIRVRRKISDSASESLRDDKSFSAWKYLGNSCFKIGIGLSGHRPPDPALRIVGVHDIINRELARDLIDRAAAPVIIRNMNLIDQAACNIVFHDSVDTRRILYILGYTADRSLCALNGSPIVSFLARVLRSATNYRLACWRFSVKLVTTLNCVESPQTFESFSKPYIYISMYNMYMQIHDRFAALAGSSDASHFRIRNIRWAASRESKARISR